MAMHVQRPHMPANDSTAKERMSLLNKLFTFAKNQPEHYTNQLKDVRGIGKH